MDDDDYEWRKLLLDNEQWKTKFEASQRINSVLVEAQMEFASIALRGTTLINGAAAIALLAFLGQVVAQNGDNKITIALDLMPSMAAFISGIFFAVTASALAYLAQTFFVEIEDDKLNRRLGNFSRWAAVITCTSGIAAFAYGGYLAVRAFTTTLSVGS